MSWRFDRPPHRRLIARACEDPPRGRVETRPVRSGPPPLGKAGRLLMGRLAQKTRYADPGLLMRWGDIVGAEFAALTRPGRMSPGRSDRSLEIMTPDGAAAAKVAFHEGALLDRLATYFGPGVVTRLKVTHAGAGQGGEPASGGGRGLSRFRDL